MSLEGKQIGPYTLIKFLGKGGMGEVWLGENRGKFVTTEVAVKLPLDEQIDHSLIEQEAQLWAKASGHPNVLPIIEATEYDGQVVIVSEYTSDGSLNDLLKAKGGKLSVEKAVEITIELLKGLGYLHGKGIIHRDLKPDNVLIQGETPRLADFGISRVIKTTQHATSRAGTPYYMAPEAFDKVYTVQTDIWEIGIILYELLSGQIPFTGNNYSELWRAITSQPPPPLPAEIPQDLQLIINKALEKSPANRFQSADEMKERLNDFLINNSRQPFQSTPTPFESQINVETHQDVRPTEASPTATPANFFPSHASQQWVTNNPSTITDYNIPTPPPPKPKRKGLYFAIGGFALFLLFFGGISIIGVGYWLLSDSTASSKNSPISNSTPKPVANITLIPYRKGNKFGYSDENKKIIIEPKYDIALPFTKEMEGLAVVGYRVGTGDAKNYDLGLIDKTGKEITQISYDLIGDPGGIPKFEDGILRVSMNEKMGFIDKSGKEVIPRKYKFVGQFKEGLARVELNNRWGFIDKSQREIIPLKYERVGDFIEDLAWVEVNDKYGFIDKIGREIVPPRYEDSYSSFSEGLAIVKSNGKFGFIDKTGEEVIPPKYDNADSFKDGLARVTLNEKDGFINKNGELVIDFIFTNETAYFIEERVKDIVEKKNESRQNDSSKNIKQAKNKIYGFNDGLALIFWDGKYGYMDTSGNKVIAPQYDSASSFSEGLATVKINGSWKFIDKNGKEVVSISQAYTYIGPFVKGLAMVKLGEKSGFIDKTGEIVFPIKYGSDSRPFDDFLFVSEKDQILYLVDKNGTEYYEP